MIRIIIEVGNFKLSRKIRKLAKIAREHPQEAWKNKKERKLLGNFGGIDVYVDASLEGIALFFDSDLKTALETLTEHQFRIFKLSKSYLEELMKEVTL